MPSALCSLQDSLNKQFYAALTGVSSGAGKSPGVPAPEAPKAPQSEKPKASRPKKRIAAQIKAFVKRHKKRTIKRVRRVSPSNTKAKMAHTQRGYAELAKKLHLGTPINQLTPGQQRKLRRIYKALLKRNITKAFLEGIRTAEGGGFKTIVGGIRGKSPNCQRSIRKLNLSGHPKDQGLPTPCFLFNRQVGKWSTAAGLLQITYSNWKRLRQPLGLKDFSEESQLIAGLELVREVNGGRGLVALIQGDLVNAVRYGTQPWASSRHSTLGGRKGDILAYARQELNRLGSDDVAQIVDLSVTIVAE